MKTLQLISTIIIVTLTNAALSNNNLESNLDLSINVIEMITPTCHYTPDGSVTIEVIGGQEPYSYDWNTYPNQTTPKAVNLKAGIYFIEITDANGQMYFQSIELDGPDMENGSLDELSTKAPDKEINIELENYRYDFSGVESSNPILEELPIGVYKVTVTNQNNCSMVQYVQIIQVESEDGKYGWGNEKDNDKPSRIVEITPLYPVEGADNTSHHPEKENLVTKSNVLNE